MTYTHPMAFRHFLISAVLSLLAAAAAAADRAHGLTTESPMAISPEAYAFFHPHAAMQPSASSTMPLAATVNSTPAHESTSDNSSSRGIGAGGIAGICMSFISVCAIGLGVLYVIKRRRASDNAERTKQEPPAEV